jgi:putative FmdB family regulatory protein
MPVYEYECKECQKVFEVQQKISEEPLKTCPDCQGQVRKLMSMTSFQLRGGGWYADGYSNASAAPAPACPSGGSCAGCPAAATT